MRTNRSSFTSTPAGSAKALDQKPKPKRSKREINQLMLMLFFILLPVLGLLADFLPADALAVHGCRCGGSCGDVARSCVPISGTHDSDGGIRIAGGIHAGNGVERGTFFDHPFGADDASADDCTGGDGSTEFCFV